ncbi:hypothetical protein [Azospirillum argentinense]
MFGPAARSGLVAGLCFIVAFFVTRHLEKWALRRCCRQRQRAGVKKKLRWNPYFLCG